VAVDDRKARHLDQNANQLDFKHLGAEHSNAISSPKLPKYHRNADVESTLYDYQGFVESHNTSQMRKVMNNKLTEDELNSIVKSLSSQSRNAKTVTQSRLESLPKLASTKNQFVQKNQPLLKPPA